MFTPTLLILPILDAVSICSKKLILLDNGA